jgi:hypothetical protein
VTDEWTKVMTISSNFIRNNGYNEKVREKEIFSSETTGPIATKLWWNGSWMAPFQNCVR